MSTSTTAVELALRNTTTQRMGLGGVTRFALFALTLKFTFGRKIFEKSKWWRQRVFDCRVVSRKPRRTKRSSTGFDPLHLLAADGRLCLLSIQCTSSLLLTTAVHLTIEEHLFN